MGGKRAMGAGRSIEHSMEEESSKKPNEHKVEPPEQGTNNGKQHKQPKLFDLRALW